MCMHIGFFQQKKTYCWNYSGNKIYIDGEQIIKNIVISRKRLNFEYKFNGTHVLYWKLHMQRNNGGKPDVILMYILCVICGLKEAFGGYARWTKKKLMYAVK